MPDAPSRTALVSYARIAKLAVIDLCNADRRWIPPEPSRCRFRVVEDGIEVTVVTT